MDVTKLPFNEFIGLKPSDHPDYLLMLENNANYFNHLETVHASAQFALAEATSGHFLLNEFAGLDDIIPVVRKVEVNFRKPANGEIYSTAKFLHTEKEEVLEAINQKGRALLNVEVSLFDKDAKAVMRSVFEWLVAKR